MYYSVAKRFLDILVGLLGISFTLVVYIPIALAIKLDSSGSVIFSQLRVGKDEIPFTMYKFRTMFNSTTHGPKPEPEDGRVTRIGRFLRRTSLDELPQFINVVRGEMSLVGPRPEQLSFLPSYQHWQRRRFAVKPGMTGWWQVQGRKQAMHAHVDEDIYYVEHCSFALDLVILWKTIGAVLSGRGAV